MSVEENSPNSRNQAVELLRVISAFGIVAYHSLAPGHDVAYAGLIVFIILSPYLDCVYKRDRPRSISGLAKTFLIPWAFWMLIYGSLNIFSHRPVFPAESGFWGVLGGTSVHLWFMPAMFCVLVCLSTARQHINPIRLFDISAATAFFLLLSAQFWRPVSEALSPPLPQWAHAAPAAFIGVVLGFSDKVERVRLFIAWAALLVAVSINLAGSLPGIGVPYAIGLVAVLIATQLPFGSLTRLVDLQAISSCMLGVYLCHILFLKAVSKVTGAANYVTVAITFASALIFVWVTQTAFPPSQWVLGLNRGKGLVKKRRAETLDRSADCAATSQVE